MIVVAIIGILAAIAIPQFAAYRTRANNTKAVASVGVAKSAIAALNSDLGCYGVTDGTNSGSVFSGEGVYLGFQGIFNEYILPVCNCGHSYSSGCFSLD